MRAGAGNSTKYTPLHLIADRKQDVCTVLPAKHILTASYTTGKVGTNYSALKPPAVQLLSEFEKNRGPALIKIKLYAKLGNIF